MKKQGTHWRRINPYDCTGCGKKRYTLCRRDKCRCLSLLFIQGNTITPEMIDRAAFREFSTGTKLDTGV